jgi:hypothetical protein
MGALTALRQSVEHLDRIGDRPQLAGTVDWGIVVLQRFGELEVAAVLVGVALESPLAAINNYPGALGRNPDDPFISSLKRELGAEQFQDAIGRGARMLLEDVVPYLYREIDRILAQPVDA